MKQIIIIISIIAISAIILIPNKSEANLAINKRNISGIWYNKINKFTKYTIIRENGTSIHIVKAWRFGRWVYMDSSIQKWKLVNRVVKEGNEQKLRPTVKIVKVTDTTLTVLTRKSGDGRKAAWGKRVVLTKKKSLPNWARSIYRRIKKDRQEELSSPQLNRKRLIGIWEDATKTGTPDYLKKYFRISSNGNLLLIYPKSSNSAVSYTFTPYECYWKNKGDRLYNKCHGRGWLPLFKIISINNGTITIRKRNYNYPDPSAMWTIDMTYKKLKTAPKIISSTLTHFK